MMPAESSRCSMLSSRSSSCFVSQESEQLRERFGAAVEREAQRLRDGRQDGVSRALRVGLVHGGKRHEHGSAGKRAGPRLGRLESQARLADAALPDKGQQPAVRIGQKLRKGSEVVRTSNETKSADRATRSAQNGIARRMVASVTSTSCDGARSPRWIDSISSVVCGEGGTSSSSANSRTHSSYWRSAAAFCPSAA